MAAQQSSLDLVCGIGMPICVYPLGKLVSLTTSTRAWEISSSRKLSLPTAGMYYVLSGGRNWCHRRGAGFLYNDTHNWHCSPFNTTVSVPCPPPLQVAPPELYFCDTYDKGNCSKSVTIQRALMSRVGCVHTCPISSPTQRYWCVMLIVFL